MRKNKFQAKQPSNDLCKRLALLWATDVTVQYVLRGLKQINTNDAWIHQMVKYRWVEPAGVPYNKGNCLMQDFKVSERGLDCIEYMLRTARLKRAKHKRTHTIEKLLNEALQLVAAE